VTKFLAESSNFSWQPLATLLNSQETTI